MSRIHEALKKAAQERSTQLATELEAGLGEVAGEIPRSVTGISGSARPAALSQVIAAGNQAVPLRYEELVKRCAHCKWRFNPLDSAFQKSKTYHGGSERFRTLRSRLYQIAGARTLRRLLVTSSLSAEGKTFVAANLAHSIIQQPDRRVLLIDADLRASRLHLALGAPSGPGLTDYLRGDADEYAVIQRGEEANLCFIPGGNEVSNPSELLLSDRMKHLLDLVSPMFDFVILDSPPAIPVHDPSLLADLCDGTLFVLRAGVTEVDVAARAVAEFQEKNLLGVVLNGVGPDAEYGRYDARYGHEDT